jgi:hypothetical protein
LDKVEKGERRFGGRADDDEVEGRVVSVGHERGCIVVLRGRGMRLGSTSQERRETALR